MIVAIRRQVSALHHVPIRTGTCLPKPTKSDPRIRQYLPLCKSLARQYLRKLGGQLEFDDLVSIGQVAVWRSTLTHREDGGASFGTYVYLAVVHAMEAEQTRAWRIGRRAWLKQASIHPANDDDLGIDLPSSLPSPYALLAAARDARTVRAALDRLTPRQRDVLRKLYFDDLDPVEVATLNSRSKQAVQQLGVYALRALEGLLSDAEGSRA